MALPPPDLPADTDAVYPRDVEKRRIPSTDGVALAVHDFGGSGPPLLLCHPTGFHGLTWLPVARELTSMAHVYSLDFRGHGDSTHPASGSFAWSGMTEDVLAVVDHLGLDTSGREPLVAAGHSMGGAALLMAEQARPDLFSALWCFEPIVPRGLPANLPAADFPMARAARRRKAVFPDRATALANYAAKPPLSSLAPEALEAYVSYGFRDLPSGGVELKCTPETEALCFEGSLNDRVFSRLGEVQCPVTIVASGDGGFPAGIAPAVAEALPKGQLERMDDLTHFGPMQDPAAVARHIQTRGVGK